MNQSLQQSPRRCGNSGGALISLIGRLGVEHIIEFDLPHHQTPPAPQHTHAHTLQTQFTSALVIGGHLNHLEHSTSLLYIKQMRYATTSRSSLALSDATLK